MKLASRAGGALCLAIVVSACGGPVVNLPAIISEGFCYPSDGRVAASRTEALPVALPGFSEPARRVAASIGASPLLAEILSPRTPELRRLRLRQAALERIVAAQLDVQESLALLDCEGERGDQLRGVLEAREARRNRRLTLASIGFGAATAVATGGLALAGAGTAAAAAGIAGGSGEASAGVAQLFEGPRGVLSTRRNLLREVRDRPRNSTLLPLFVWSTLQAADAEGVSDLERVWGQWEGAGLMGEADGARTALLFGEGGPYSVDDLLARGAMLDGIEAAIGRANRSLRLLLAEMERVLEDR